MEYKVTLELCGKYTMEIEACDLVKAAQKAEEIFANKPNFNDATDLTGKAVLVERIKS